MGMVQICVLPKDWSLEYNIGRGKFIMYFHLPFMPGVLLCLPNIECVVCFYHYSDFDLDCH